MYLYQQQNIVFVNPVLIYTEYYYGLYLKYILPLSQRTHFWFFHLFGQRCFRWLRGFGHYYSGPQDQQPEIRFTLRKHVQPDLPGNRLLGAYIIKIIKMNIFAVSATKKIPYMCKSIMYEFGPIVLEKSGVKTLKS